MLRDIFFAFRVLRKSSAFLLTAVLSLALGIGATTTVFSAFRAVFLRPLPFAEPEQLVEITKPAEDGGLTSPTIADVTFLRQFGRSFAMIGTYGPFRSVTMLGGAEPVSGTARMVHAEMFPTLGARPVIGRVFVPADFEDGNPRAVLLSDRIWRQQFGGDAGVVGRRVMLDSDSYIVAGVMPREFQFRNSFFNMWIADREKPNPVNRVTALGRLKPGVTLQAAQAEMDRLLPSLLQQYSEGRRHFRVRLAPYGERTGATYDAFRMLCGAVGLLVLIACLNVGNLAIARSVAREGEFAVRSALGAGRGRLMRQVMAESLVLAVAGGTAGLLLAWIGNHALTASLPANYAIDRLGETRLDFAVLAFSLGLTLVTAVLFGVGPMLIFSRCNLRDFGRTATAGKVRWRGMMVTAEVALSLTLLIGAGLLVRSFLTLAKADPGFRPDHVLSAMAPASAQVVKDKPKLLKRMKDILQIAQQLPGVDSAGLSTAIPMGPINVSITFALPERPNEEIGINYRAVSAGYFQTLGVPLKLGRVFTERDDQNSANVAVVNEAFAKKYFAGRMPIGQKLVGGREVTIVGVVADLHNKVLSDPVEPEVYCPFMQNLGPAPGTTIVMRTSRDPAGLATAFRREVHALYPDQPVTDVATMEVRVADSMAAPRLYTALLGLFAAVALALTAVGIYGVTAYATNQRRREVGIRIALGAQVSNVLRLVMGGAFRAIAIGVVVGVAGAWALGRYMASMLYGVTSRDAAAFLLAPAVLLAIAGVACYVPARRAAGVDPNTVLREE